MLDLEDLARRESHESLAKGLLLSGLAMAAAGTSRPCSGAEHLISHSLDRLLGERAAMHGEQVALGCLFAAAAHDSPLLEIARPHVRAASACRPLPRRPGSRPRTSSAPCASRPRRDPSASRSSPTSSPAAATGSAKLAEHALAG